MTDTAAHTRIREALERRLRFTSLPWESVDSRRGPAYLQIREPYDGDVDGDTGQHIVVGGEHIVTIEDTEHAEEIRELIVEAVNALPTLLEALTKADQMGDSVMWAARSLLEAHDASAHEPDRIDLENAELERFADLRAALSGLSLPVDEAGALAAFDRLENNRDRWYPERHEDVEAVRSTLSPPISGDAETLIANLDRLKLWCRDKDPLATIWLHIDEAQAALRRLSLPADGWQTIDDAALLDALRDESWELRNFSMPTGGDDADIGWRVVGHWMAEPCERVIAEEYSDDPRKAIRAAIKATSKSATTEPVK